MPNLRLVIERAGDAELHPLLQRSWKFSMESQGSSEIRIGTSVDPTVDKPDVDLAVFSHAYVRRLTPDQCQISLEERGFTISWSGNGLATHLMPSGDDIRHPAKIRQLLKTSRPVIHHGDRICFGDPHGRYIRLRVELS